MKVRPCFIVAAIAAALAVTPAGPAGAQSGNGRRDGFQPPPAALPPPEAPRARPLPRRCHVLAVGVGTFQDRRIPALAPAKGAGADGGTAGRRGPGDEARDVAAFFEARFPGSWTKILTEQQATRAAILDALRELEAAAGPGDMAVVYLSGHGGRTRGDWYFVPHDLEPGRGLETGLTTDEIRKDIAPLAWKGCRVLLVVDACFAGQITDTFLIDRAFPDQGRGGLILMLSSVPSQMSLQGWDGGLFTRAWLEALRGDADGDHDGLVTLREVRRYLRVRLWTLSRRNPARLPGLNWSEQNSDCEWSASIPETFALTRATREEAFPIPSDVYVPSLPSGFGNSLIGKESPTAEQLVGTWELRLPKGEPAADVYRIEFFPNGTYRAELRPAFGEDQATRGRYTFERGTDPKRQDIRLAFPNGEDLLVASALDGDVLSFSVEISQRLTGVTRPLRDPSSPLGPRYKLERVRP